MQALERLKKLADIVTSLQRVYEIEVEEAREGKGYPECRDQHPRAAELARSAAEFACLEYSGLVEMLKWGVNS
jgi:hypothetical protein